MKKRLGLLLTVAMVATSIVGCGGSASNTAETTETTVAAETTEATASESTVEAVESGEEVSAKLQELRRNRGIRWYRCSYFKRSCKEIRNWRS